MSERLRTRRDFLASASLGVAGAALWGCGSPAPARHGAPVLDVTGPASLREHAANARMLFGMAVDTRSLRNNERYRRTVQQQCSIIVAENAMKWSALRPSPGQFNFDEADALLTFAESNRIKMRGHNLCWHEGLPAWLSRDAGRANARQLLTDHIRTVAGRYSGRMHSWDVVNEAVDVKDGRPDGLRNSLWLQFVGTDYIEVAFRAAREADPSALLTYNDYGLEEETHEAAEKRAAVLLLLRRLKQRNVPIDAVGIQSHLRARSLYGYGAGLRQFIDACRSIDLEIFVSELDVNDRDLPANTDARDEGVEQTYRSYLAAVLAARNVTTVITWGVDDAQTWLNTGAEARRDHLAQRPLLFDAGYHAKPAFAAVREAFVQRSPNRIKPLPAQAPPQRLPRL